MVRVALVGCGRVSDLHVLGYRGREDARITAVCDSNGRTARRKAAEWGVEAVYTDYERLLADADVDLVELLVPHHLHASMTVAACQAGKHVSVQKPMALSVAQCDQMIDAARSNGVVLRVYENFVFYPPCVRAKAMIDAGEVGEPQMIRLHMNTGSRDTAWKVPLRAWLWRFNERKAGGGPLVFDHGYHLFSLARYLMGDVTRVYAWIDRSPVLPTKVVDAPATVMFQFESPHRYGTMDIAHTPKMRIHSDFYADDNRVEIIGDRGILFINRCTARTVDLPALMMFRNGVTTPVPIERDEWQHSFIDSTRQLLDCLADGEQPKLNGAEGKAVLQIVLAALQSARSGREIRPADVT
jgi:predicted dehydrogenase